jgi:PAS domain S-box-containing protein
MSEHPSSAGADQAPTAGPADPFRAVHEVGQGSLGLALVDNDGTVNWMDQACRGLLGNDNVAGGLPAMLRAAGVEETTTQRVVEHLWSGVPFVMECRFGQEGGRNWLRIKGGGSHDAANRMLVLFEDVSQRRRAEWNILAMVQRYHDALRGSVDALWEWDLQRSRMVWSMGLERLLGIPSSEIVDDGSHWHQRLEQDTLDRIDALVRDLVAGRVREYEMEYMVRAQDRGPFWVRTRGVVLEYDGEGRPLRLFGVITDIDRIKRAEQEHASWERRLSTLIDDLGVGVVLEDAGHRIILADRTYCGYLGLQPQDVIGRTSYEVMSAPDVRSLIDDPNDFVLKARACVMAGERVEGERIELTDGRVFERDYTPMRLDDGRMTGHLWVYREITDRLALQAEKRRQEERFRQLIDNMGLGRMELDPDLRVVEVNEHLCTWVGTTRKDVLGRTVAELPSASDLEELVRRNLSERARGISGSFEVVVTHRDGSLRQLHVSGAPRFDAKGAFKGTVAVFVDLTEHRHMEEQLRITGAQAVSALRAKELFLANMGHELRTPLNAIIGIGSEVLRSLGDADTRRNMDTVLQAARDLRDLVNDILQQARAGSDTRDLDLERLDVRALVEYVGAINTHDALHAGLVLRTHVSPQVGAGHLGDVRRIKQVLLNLLSNAIKFTRKGAVELLVDGAPMEAGRQRLTFTVKDTGVGISPEFMSQLFQPFSRDPALAEAAIDGSGLGLSISHHLVERMGGTIAVESVPGSGTKVRVQLVLDVTDEQVHAEEGLGATMVEPLPPGHRALVVDDSPTNRTVLRTMLSAMGLQVDEAATGSDALMYLCGSPCDILFLDLQMPDMDGWELLRIMRDVMSGGPCTVVVTAGDTDGSKVEWQGLQVPVVQKPFEREELLAAIRQCQGGFGWDPDGRLPGSLYAMDRLFELAAGDDAVVRRVIAAFVADVPLVATQLVEDAHAGNMAGLAALAHRLKPSLRMFGQDAIVDLLDEMMLPANACCLNKVQGMAMLVRWRIAQVANAIAQDSNGHDGGHG